MGARERQALYFSTLSVYRNLGRNKISFATVNARVRLSAKIPRRKFTRRLDSPSVS